MSALARARAGARSFPSPSSLNRLRIGRPALFSTSVTLATSDRRPQNFDSGFTSSYDPNNDPTRGRGPIFSKSAYGVPQFYPRDLKRRVDDYVVGQERAKKTICSVIFNHYQNLRRRQAHELSDQKFREKVQRQKYLLERAAAERAHPVEGGRWLFDNPATLRSRRQADQGRYYIEDEFPGHNEPVRRTHLPSEDSYNPSEDKLYLEEDPAVPKHVKIDKSNLLLIGPTGVGKTYILETLSKKLNVPFTISDCNSFTQAGYIGQDVEACIERLLIEANFDVKAAEHGIVVLDEFDKIARRETVNGRDVGGEGVQQALLKLVEGTKVTIHVKDHRSSRPPATTSNPYGPSGIPTPPLPSSKAEQYIVDTTNILFVFCGAFVGLDKAVLRRVAKPSIGFGSEIRTGRSLSKSKNLLPFEMYSHLPHQPCDFPLVGTTEVPHNFTPLDLTTPQDLQAFGFIPELIGRLHNICALTPLSLDELYRILTEPRNSLVAQYTALFETYPSKLFFTRRALYAIAERAAKNETGARGLKMEMERVLAEPMFDSPMQYVLVTEGCVNGTERASYWGKDGKLEVERRIREEDDREGGGEETFEQLREAGLSGA